MTISDSCLGEQDVAFVAYRNESRNTEFAMQVIKDAKGMTLTPGRRSVLRVVLS